MRRFSKYNSAAGHFERADVCRWLAGQAAKAQMCFCIGGMPAMPSFEKLNREIAKRKSELAAEALWELCAGMVLLKNGGPLV